MVVVVVVVVVGESLVLVPVLLVLLGLLGLLGQWGSEGGTITLHSEAKQYSVVIPYHVSLPLRLH